MLVDNDTPFAAIGFEQWHPNGATMAVVAARARLVVAPDGQIYYAQEQNLLLSDTWVGDPHKTGMDAVGDLVPFRPFADVTLLGSLHAAEPALSLSGGIRVGGHAHVIRGCGPRVWFFERGQWQLSPVEQIACLPVDYTVAAGGRIIGDPDGAVEPRNPIGTGVIHPEFTPKTITVPAPQIDSAEFPLSSDPTRPAAPEGFGPVSPWWQSRSRHTGTYDETWLRETHPRLPADFDWRFYQAAHPGLIMPGYLRPGMLVETFGLMPGGASLNFHIPDIVPVARFSFTDGREVEARLHLDGLHLDLRGEQPVFDLTWRTWIQTCPALYRADLACGTSAEVMPKRLPVADADGLVAEV